MVVNILSAIPDVIFELWRSFEYPISNKEYRILKCSNFEFRHCEGWSEWSEHGLWQSAWSIWVFVLWRLLRRKAPSPSFDFMAPRNDRVLVVWDVNLIQPRTPSARLRIHSARHLPQGRTPWISNIGISNIQWSSGWTMVGNMNKPHFEIQCSLFIIRNSNRSLPLSGRRKISLLIFQRGVRGRMQPFCQILSHP
jgi:hypothetical protein